MAQYPVLDDERHCRRLAVAGENRVVPDTQADQYIQIRSPIVEHLGLKRRIAAGFVAAGADFQLVRQADFRFIDRTDLADDSLRFDSGCPYDLGVDRCFVQQADAACNAELLHAELHRKADRFLQPGQTTVIFAFDFGGGPGETPVNAVAFIQSAREFHGIFVFLGQAEGRILLFTPVAVANCALRAAQAAFFFIFTHRLSLHFHDSQISSPGSNATIVSA